MINDKDIVFITTSTMSKWIGYQSKLIKHHFPDSDHIIVNGSSMEFKKRWPNSWFDFLSPLNSRNEKFYVHIDEDFFLDSREELLKVIEKMDSENIGLMGVSEGNQHYRSANPVAINAFLMIGRTDDIRKINIDKLSNTKYFMGTYDGKTYGWFNELGIKYKPEYGEGFEYRFTKNGGTNYDIEQEPYYSFIWYMKEIGCRFDYLFPHFDGRFKSTNPRLEEDSVDIGYHMWYTRNWYDNSDVWGMKNVDRYNEIEKFLLSKYKSIF